MDIFDSYTEIGDVVEVIVDGDPCSTVDAFVLMIEEQQNDKYKVQLGLTETNLDYTIIMERGMNFNIYMGSSDQELRKFMKRTTNIKDLVGMKRGSKNDARAKYEAFLDCNVAAIVEHSSGGLKTRNSFFKRKI